MKASGSKWKGKSPSKTPRLSLLVVPFIIKLGGKNGRLPHYYHIETGSNSFKSDENWTNEISRLDTRNPRKTLG